jgi:polyisoprenoid-binding protein YceI
MKSILIFLLTTSFAFSSSTGDKTKTMKMNKSYSIDNTKSNVGFSIEKYKIGSLISGKFTTYDGSFSYDAKTKTIDKVKANISISSINTADEKRDGHLKSPDFFDAAKFPTMTFVSTGSAKLENKNKFKGNLTLKGVSKEVELTISGVKKTKAGLEFTAQTTIDRYAFGITWNKRMDTKKEESILDQIANATKGLINKYVIDNKVNVKLTIVTK